MKTYVKISRIGFIKRYFGKLKTCILQDDYNKVKIRALFIIKLKTIVFLSPLYHLT